MPPRPPVRDAAPFLKAMRTVLLGRECVLNNRYPADQSPRDQPPANIPLGIHNKLSANYYFTRDSRGSIIPDEVIAINSKNSSTPLFLSSAEEEVEEEEEEDEEVAEDKDSGSTIAVAKRVPKIPGQLYNPPCALNI